ncbi:hypothetical protein ABMA70_03060 [Halobacteriovorax sp. XZX-3]|uniref:hypothetical protein n=1 Tax=unclassified Halobacteriovorax TaxID=2639665 RepID=UPI00371C5A82
MIYKTTKIEYFRDRFLFPILFTLAPLGMVLVAVYFGLKEERLKDLFGFIIIGIVIELFCLFVFARALFYYKKVEVSENGIVIDGRKINWDKVIEIKPLLHLRINLKYKDDNSIKTITFSNDWNFIEAIKYPQPTNRFLAITKAWEKSKIA